MSSEPAIFTAAYWKERLELAIANGNLHKAVYEVVSDRWEELLAKHRDALTKYIQPEDWVMDFACGYGRLIDLLPGRWVGVYCGIDISPDFIARARMTYPQHSFHCGDLRTLAPDSNVRRFQWGIFAGTRQMIRQQAGEPVWAQIERNASKWVEALLFLEYDGTVEVKYCETKTDEGIRHGAFQ